MSGYLVINAQGKFAQRRSEGLIKFVSEYPDATKFTQKAAETWVKNLAQRKETARVVSVAEYTAE